MSSSYLDLEQIRPAIRSALLANEWFAEQGITVLQEPEDSYDPAAQAGEDVLGRKVAEALDAAEVCVVLLPIDRLGEILQNQRTTRVTLTAQVFLYFISTPAAADRLLRAAREAIVALRPIYGVTLSEDPFERLKEEDALLRVALSFDIRTCM